MSLPLVDPPLKFHLSLNVSDLGRAVAFYRVLFGRPPAKHHDDYAKFELDDPLVVFSLVPRPPGPGGPLGRVGFRVADAAAVRAYRARLEAAGFVVAGDTKLSFRDPDGTQWEIAAGAADDGPAPVGDGTPEPEPVAAPARTWEHFVTQPAPERIPHADGSLDEVRLTGTFNAPINAEQQQALVREARRVLRPGGRVLVHGLMADAAFPGATPALPGLAAMVSRVPVQTEPAEALRAAGFVGVQIVKFPEKAWFEHDGVGLREVKIAGVQPPAGGSETRAVVYRGPFREVVGDDGRVYPRGERVTVPLAVWQQLRDSGTAGPFDFGE